MLFCWGVLFCWCVLLGCVVGVCLEVCSGVVFCVSLLLFSGVGLLILSLALFGPSLLLMFFRSSVLVWCIGAPLVYLGRANQRPKTDKNVKRNIGQSFLLAQGLHSKAV